MRTIEAFAHGDGAHCGLTDWYPEKEAALKAALESGQPFDTGWYASKKEIASARIWVEDGMLKAEVSVSNDFDTNGLGHKEHPLPCSMEDVANTVGQAWDDATEDQEYNTNYLGYSIRKHKRGGHLSWCETFLVCLDGSDAPGGDYYHAWGWQNDSDIKLPKKTLIAFEQFAHEGRVGEMQIGPWSIKSWHDKPVEFEDPNDYAGMGWVGRDGRP